MTAYQTDNSVFISLLSSFVSLPKNHRSQTILQVAGYTHYENVWSNLLAFFMRPEEEHGLSTLFLDALIALHPEGITIPTPSEARVYREFYTSKGKFIDLIIETDTCVIAVENKVHHWVANDLNHYSDEAVNLTRGDCPCLKFVLGIRAENNLKGGFVSITYPELWDQVRDNLGKHAASADPRWLQHLLDFIQTTEYYTPFAHMELSPQDRFFIDNHEALEQLEATRSQFINRLLSRTPELLRVFLDSKKWQPLVIKEPYHYNRKDGNCMVLDLMILGQECAIDTMPTPHGWLSQVFFRSGKTEGLLQLTGTSPFKDIAENGHFEGQRYYMPYLPLDTPLEAIADYLFKLLNDIIVTHQAIECQAKPAQ